MKFFLSKTCTNCWQNGALLKSSPVTATAIPEPQDTWSPAPSEATATLSPTSPPQCIIYATLLQATLFLTHTHTHKVRIHKFIEKYDRSILKDRIVQA